MREWKDQRSVLRLRRPAGSGEGTTTSVGTPLQSRSRPRTDLASIGSRTEALKPTPGGRVGARLRPREPAFPCRFTNHRFPMCPKPGTPDSRVFIRSPPGNGDLMKYGGFRAPQIAVGRERCAVSQHKKRGIGALMLVQKYNGNERIC